MAAGVRSKTVALAACYALSVTSISLNVASAPIVGKALAPSAALATFPVALAILGTMAASLPMSLLMARFGRRAGFLLGTSVGLVGAAAASFGIAQGSFVLFCVGLVGLGVLNGTAQLYRFAAADAAEPSAKARAISWVLAGGVVAGLIGPRLAAGTKDLLSAEFAGSYAIVMGLYVAAFAILLRLRLAPPVEEEAARPPRPLGVIVRQPLFLAAVTASMIAYGVMALIMTATPLSMQAAGHDFDASAWVIQAHVVAMFAPSFVTGRLIQRFGSHRVITAGLLGLGLCIAIALQGQTAVHYWIALAALGVGWNFLFVTGSSMLTRVHRTAERGKVQGVNDLLVFGSAAAGSLAAGPLQSSLGWTGLQAWLAPGIVLAAGTIALLGLWVRWSTQAAASATDSGTQRPGAS